MKNNYSKFRTIVQLAVCRSHTAQKLILPKNAHHNYTFGGETSLQTVAVFQ